MTCSLATFPISPLDFSAMNHDELWSRPRIMGIININDDSFSNDGTLDTAEALKLALGKIAEGADFIDIGAESARTNRDAISEDEEIARLLPFLDQWKTTLESAQPRFKEQCFPPLLSVNSWRPKVIETVLKTGEVDLINDIGGLDESTSAGLCAKHGAMLLIMHTVGQPKVPHRSEVYDDVLSVLDSFFDEKIKLAKLAGLTDQQILLDPGIDFAKQKDDNLKILSAVEKLKRFGYPILLPISRKTVIGETLDLPNPEDRDAGTLACLARGIEAGAKVFRVHDVGSAADTARVLHTLTND